MVADGSRAVVLGLLVVALAAGRLTVAGALIALGLLATAEVFADNTSATLTPMLVPRDDLAVANARLQVGLPDAQPARRPADRRRAVRGRARSGRS